jgi:hypothetical protein
MKLLEIVKAEFYKIKKEPKLLIEKAASSLMGASVFLLFFSLGKIWLDNLLPLIVALFVNGMLLLLTVKAKKFKYKKILFIATLFTFLNTIVFPLIYFVLLSVNPKSFEINQMLLETEVDLFKNTTEVNYQPKILKHQIALIKKISVSSSSALETPIEYLNNSNVLSIDSFLLYKGIEFTDSRRSMRKKSPRGGYASLVITDKNGVYLNSVGMSSSSAKNLAEQMTLKDFLSYRVKKLEKQYLAYQLEIQNGKINKIWSFPSVIKHSVTIFNTSNFNPISPIANCMWWIQVAVTSIISVILLALITNPFLSKTKFLNFLK